MIVVPDSTNTANLYCSTSAILLYETAAPETQEHEGGETVAQETQKHEQEGQHFVAPLPLPHEDTQTSQNDKGPGVTENDDDMTIKGISIVPGDNTNSHVDDGKQSIAPEPPPNNTYHKATTIFSELTNNNNKFVKAIKKIQNPNFVPPPPPRPAIQENHDKNPDDQNNIRDPYNDSRDYDNAQNVFQKRDPNEKSGIDQSSNDPTKLIKMFQDKIDLQTPRGNPLPNAQTAGNPWQNFQQYPAIISNMFYDYPHWQYSAVSTVDDQPFCNVQPLLTTPKILRLCWLT